MVVLPFCSITEIIIVSLIVDAKEVSFCPDFAGSDKNLGLQKKRETPTVKANESLLNHRRRPLSCKYKYRSPSRLGQAQAYPRWNNVFKKQVNRRCERH